MLLVVASNGLARNASEEDNPPVTTPWAAAAVPVRQTLSHKSVPTVHDKQADKR